MFIFILLKLQINKNEVFIGFRLLLSLKCFFEYDHIIIQVVKNPTASKRFLVRQTHVDSNCFFSLLFYHHTSCLKALDE